MKPHEGSNGSGTEAVAVAEPDDDDDDDDEPEAREVGEAAAADLKNPCA